MSMRNIYGAASARLRNIFNINDRSSGLQNAVKLLSFTDMTHQLPVRRHSSKSFAPCPNSTASRDFPSSPAPSRFISILQPGLSRFSIEAPKLCSPSESHCEIHQSHIHDRSSLTTQKSSHMTQNIHNKKDFKQRTRFDYNPSRVQAARSSTAAIKEAGISPAVWPGVDRRNSRASNEPRVSGTTCSSTFSP